MFAWIAGKACMVISKPLQLFNRNEKSRNLVVGNLILLPLRHETAVFNTDRSKSPKHAYAHTLSRDLHTEPPERAVEHVKSIMWIHPGNATKACGETVVNQSRTKRNACAHTHKHPIAQIRTVEQSIASDGVCTQDARALRNEHRSANLIAAADYAQ